MAGIPLKLCIPRMNVKIGVVAQSLEHLRAILKEKFRIAAALIALEDGTIIFDEDYFSVLKPQTPLSVILPETAAAFSKHINDSTIVEGSTYLGKKHDDQDRLRRTLHYEPKSPFGDKHNPMIVQTRQQQINWIPRQAPPPPHHHIYAHSPYPTPSAPWPVPSDQIPSLNHQQYNRRSINAQYTQQDQLVMQFEMAARRSSDLTLSEVFTQHPVSPFPASTVQRPQLVSLNNKQPATNTGRRHPPPLLDTSLIINNQPSVRANHLPHNKSVQVQLLSRHRHITGGPHSEGLSNSPVSFPLCNGVNGTSLSSGEAPGHAVMQAPPPVRASIHPTRSQILSPLQPPSCNGVMNSHHNIQWCTTSGNAVFINPPAAAIRTPPIQSQPVSSNSRVRLPSQPVNLQAAGIQGPPPNQVIPVISPTQSQPSGRPVNTQAATIQTPLPSHVQSQPSNVGEFLSNSVNSQVATIQSPPVTPICPTQSQHCSVGGNPQAAAIQNLPPDQISPVYPTQSQPSSVGEVSVNFSYCCDRDATPVSPSTDVETAGHVVSNLPTSSALTVATEPILSPIGSPVISKQHQSQQTVVDSVPDNESTAETNVCDDQIYLEEGISLCLSPESDGDNALCIDEFAIVDKEFPENHQLKFTCSSSSQDASVPSPLTPPKTPTAETPDDGDDSDSSQISHHDAAKTTFPEDFSRKLPFADFFNVSSPCSDVPITRDSMANHSPVSPLSIDTDVTTLKEIESLELMETILFDSKDFKSDSSDVTMEGSTPIDSKESELDLIDVTSVSPEPMDDDALQQQQRSDYNLQQQPPQSVNTNFVTSVVTTTEEDRDDEVDELVVTFQTVCRNGEIKIMTDRGIFVPPKTVVGKGVQSPSKNLIDLTKEEDELEMMEIGFIQPKKERIAKGSEIIEEINNEKCELNDSKEMIPVMEYGCEEVVHSVSPENRCTDEDVDRCVGALLQTVLSYQKTLNILDRESILELHTRSCGASDCPEVSNEVEVNCMAQNSLVRFIPLSNVEVPEYECSRRLSKEMLSYK